jgi:membrane protein DedA with SNARE-associated domain
MDAVLAWLTELPPAALYLALAVTAALENFFPPLPADTVVAFGSFLAARGQGTMLGAFLSTWLGNVVGALIVYGLGRRFGAGEMRKRLLRYGGERAEQRVEILYRKRGMLAIFLSRFLPGARAIVPPFAGALRLPVGRVAASIAIASAIWYGSITITAYRVGESWSSLLVRLAALSRNTALAAAGVVLIIAAVAFLRRRVRGR